MVKRISALIFKSLLYFAIQTNPLSIMKTYPIYKDTSEIERWLINIIVCIANIFLLQSCTLCNCKNNDEYINSFLDSNRNNEAALIAFFSKMPKGGDLHNHFTGSIYAETYWDYIVKHNYYLNTSDLTITASKPKKEDLEFFKQLNNKLPEISELRQKLLQRWSVKDYYDAFMPSDKHFFDAFKRFPSGDDLTEEGLLELKRRAIAENIQYLELMYKSVPLPDATSMPTLDSALLSIESQHDSTALTGNLALLINSLNEKNKADSCANLLCNNLESIHHKLQIDDSAFTMRYMTFANRTDAPQTFFTKLYLAFKAAKQDTLLVGVNILSPEDNPIAMRDYWLHMQMFNYCHKLFPDVKYSIHAGELTEGLVKPEDLTFHIHDALLVAGANRIGHGVDIPYETDCYSLLHYMHDHKIPVEINLSSNEFILKVKNNQHPIMMYFKSGVPIVISADDAGVLRTSLTKQFVLLAERYPQLRYTDIKRFVYNSIDNSFLKNKTEKKKQIQKLNKKFMMFETSFVNDLNHN